MKTTTIFILSIVCILLYSCTNKLSSDFQIQSGIAHVSGKISGTLPDELQEKPVIINLHYGINFLPIEYEYETTMNEDGTFRFDVPVVGSFLTMIGNEALHTSVYLVPNETTELEIFLDETGQPNKVTMANSSGLTGQDMLHIADVFVDAVYSHRDIVATPVIPNQH